MSVWIAAKLVIESAEIVSKNDEHYYEAERFRVQGDLAAASGDLSAASGDLAAASGDLAAASGDLAAASGDLAAAEDCFPSGMTLAGRQAPSRSSCGNAMGLAVGAPSLPWRPESDAARRDTAV